MTNRDDWDDWHWTPGPKARLASTVAMYGFALFAVCSVVLIGMDAYSLAFP